LTCETFSFAANSGCFHNTIGTLPIFDLKYVTGEIVSASALENSWKGSLL